LHIVAADADPAVCELYRAVLPALGHDVLVVGSGRQAADLCRAMSPDLLITDDLSPDQDGRVPVVLVSDQPPDNPGPASPVLAYLGRPVHPAALRAAVATAARLRALEGEVAELRQAMEDRKMIERAKGLVARYVGLGEEEAYRRLRTLASHENRKLVEVAQGLIAAGHVFSALEQTAAARSAANGHARSHVTNHRATVPN
jgi:CheY-like chemotaxis protein